MPHVYLLLTNGGFGSIQIALAHGVTIVRVPSEKQIRAAVTKVLTRSSYHERAAELAREMAGLDAARGGADLLEELSGARALAKSA